MQRSRAWWDILIIVAQNQQDISQQLLCKLLLVSRSVRCVVRDTCRGQAHISFETDDLKHLRRFCGWLHGHAALVKLLQWSFNTDHRLPVPSDHLLTAEASIAAALNTAAERQQLQLQHYCCPRATRVNLAVLQQLPSSHLTSVDISCPSWYEDEPLEAAFRVRWQAVLQQSDAALSRLTSLRTLTISSNSSPYVEQLSTLTALTCLHLLGRGAVLIKQLACLPAQLQQLTIQVENKHSAALDLGHLTALQQLNLSGNCIMKAADVLPPHLTAATLACEGMSVKPLLRLRKLHLLALGPKCTLPCGDLLELSGRLSGLTELHLAYTLPGASCNLGRESAAWACLPLKQLAISGPHRISSSTLARLGQLSGLTSLELYRCVFDDMPREAAKQLKLLTGLQELRMTGLFLAPGSTGSCYTGSCYAGTRAVLQVIAGLPQLTSLHIFDMRLGGMARELATARNLQHLTLRHCDLTNAAVYDVCGGCKQLQELDNRHNFQLTNEAFGVEKRVYRWHWLRPVQLPRLRRLTVWGTDITLEGVQHLKSVTKLEGRLM